MHMLKDLMSKVVLLVLSEWEAVLGVLRMYGLFK